MQLARIHTHVSSNAIRNRQERLSLSNGDNRFSGSKWEQLMKSPNPTQSKRIATSHPLSLKQFKGAWSRKPVPIVGYIQKIPTCRTARQHFVNRKRRTTRRSDALLKCEISTSGNGQSSFLQIKGLLKTAYILYFSAFGGTRLQLGRCSAPKLHNSVVA